MPRGGGFLLGEKQGAGHAGGFFFGRAVRGKVSQERLPKCQLDLTCRLPNTGGPARSRRSYHASKPEGRGRARPRWRSGGPLLAMARSLEEDYCERNGWNRH
jgi:hypothetical protein